MELEGRVIQHLDMVSGTSARGEWKKQEFIVETPGEYPKKVCVSLWGDKVNDLPNVGEDVSVSINIESREYNGRWYTEIRAWKVGKKSAESAGAAVPPPSSVPPQVDKLANDEGADDLPF